MACPQHIIFSKSLSGLTCVRPRSQEKFPNATPLISSFKQFGEVFDKGHVNEIIVKKAGAIA